MSVTLSDIAKKVGVSKSTVSKVLNKTESAIKISSQTKREVLKVAEELGYRPNIHARFLSKKRTFMFGLIFDNVLDPFLNEVIKGINNVTHEKGYRMLLTTFTDNETIKQAANSLINQSAVEGILIGGTGEIIVDENFINKINKKGVPVVLIAQKFKNIPSVSVDNFKGGYIAGKYLIQLGHRKLAIITGPNYLKRRDCRNRFLGFKAALKEYNIRLNEKYIEEGNFSYRSGYEAMKKIFKLKEKPEAVFACDDLMALGAINAANEYNFKVPKDISIMGFDNIVQSKYSTPKLTTISQPRIKMGERGAKLLIDLITNKEVNQDIIIFDPELIERHSCIKREI